VEREYDFCPVRRPNTHNGKGIDAILRAQSSQALYVLLLMWTELANDENYKPLIKKFKDQQCLEEAMFTTWIAATEGARDLNPLIITLCWNPTLQIMFSTAFQVIVPFTKSLKCSPDFLEQKYYRSQYPLDPFDFGGNHLPGIKPLKRDFNSKKVKADNNIQLYSKADIGENLVANRQFFHLRNAPALQIRETLDYFKVHLDKLSDRDNQIYMEANLFQPGLLLDELGQRNDILQLVKDFVDAGLQHHITLGQCTPPSLFFLRIEHLVYDYAAKNDSPQAIAMLEGLQQRLIGLLDINKDNTRAIKHTLHQYQFLTAMSRLGKKPEMGSATRETITTLAMTSFFCMNASSNPNMELDKATQFELNCRKHEVGHLLDTLSPEFKQTLRNTILANLGLGDVNGFSINIKRGQVYDDKGWSCVPTPLHIVEYAKSLYLDLVVPELSCVNKSEEIWEIGFPTPVLRYSSTVFVKNRLEKLWTVSGQSSWYMPRDKNFSDSWLPIALEQQGCHLWENGHTLLITENKRPIYRCKVEKRAFEQLDADGQSNGYILCLGDTWLHELLSSFESPKFITVCKKDNDFKAELCRYGLTVLASKERGSWITYGEWVFRLESHPRYRLLTDADTQRCSKLPSLPGAATLIFEEEHTKQRRSYIPMQPFVATNTRSPHSEFYHFEQDISARVVKHIVKDALPDALPSSRKLTKSESFVTFLLSKDGVPQPENAQDALFLCYVCLGNHRPEQAWAVLDDAAKRLGGLKGTAEELSLLQMIVEELPIVLDAEAEKASVGTPPYIACKLKALAMLVSVMTPDKKNDLPESAFDETTPNGVYENKKLGKTKVFYYEKTKVFYDNLNTTLFKLYSRYQSMNQDITHGFHLLDEERQQLLEYYHYNLPGKAPKAMGALGYERQQLRLKMLIREDAAIEAMRIEGTLPPAYETRQQEIKAALEREKDVCGHHSEVALNALCLTIPPNEVVNAEKMMMLDFNITNVPSIEDLRRAMDDLTQTIDRYTFVKNFPIYFRLLLTSSDQTLRTKLIDFCYSYLLTHRHVKPESLTEIGYLCHIMYRIDSSFGLFIKNLSFMSPLVDNLSSLLPSFEIPFVILFQMAEALPDPIIEIYELRDTLSEVLPLNCAAWAAERPALGRPMVLKKGSTRLNHFTFENVLNECELDQELKTNSALYAKAYTEQASLFGAASVDTITDFATERQAGRAQGKALQGMKDSAVQLLGQKKCRDALQIKTKEFIGELHRLTEQRITMSIALANSGFELTPEQKVRKELALDSGVRAPLTKEQLLSLYFKADKAQYTLETGLPDDKIDLLHFLLTTFVALSVRRQTLQRFVDKTEALVDNSPASAMQLAAHELLTDDLVDYKTEPVMALFQYYENVLLRPQQKSALERMVSRLDGFSYAQVVEQVIMGGGKSKVLLPLLARKKATGTNMVVVEVPRGLFETNCADLSATSRRLFDQKVFAFDFNRETNCSPDYLELLYSRLIDVIVRKDYVVTTGDAVQSLELKYLEILLEPKPEEDAEKTIWNEQVSGLDKLVNLFRTRADAVIDEVHQALLLKKKLNYTLGDGESISLEVIQKTVALFTFFENVPLSVMEGKSLSDLLDNNQLLTKDEDWKTAMQDLADMLVSHTESPLKSELEQMTEEDKAQVHRYLLDQSGLDLPNAGVKVCNIIARYKEQVNQLLPLMLRRNLNEHYGASHMHPDADSAIPYSANNEPSERSRFGNNREAMNFTIQMVMKEGLSSELLHRYLSQLQQQAALELIRMPQVQQINNTPTGKLFHQWVPDYQLSQINVNDKDAFSPVFHALRYHKGLICKVLETEILPKQTIDSEILYSNAHTHVEIYHSSQGLTGTPDYSSTWHPSLNFDKQKFAATNGFIINLLESKKTAIRSLTYKGSVETVLHHLLDGRINVHAIMDICAAFKGTPNDKVAYALTDHLRETNSSLRYVLFFNQDNKLCALHVNVGSKPIVLNYSDPDMIDKALGCWPAQRFTYYDQAHTLGTDLKQAPAAKALALVDHETQLQGFLQGAMRMRGLANEQSLEIIVPNALHHYKLDVLLDMMNQNQERQLKRDNFAATKSKMSNHVRAHIMTRVLTSSTVEEKQKLVMHYKSCFVEQATKESDFFKEHGQRSSMQKTQALLEAHRNRLLAIDPGELAVLKQGLDRLITEGLPLCQVEYLSTVGADAGTEVEIQNQVEVQQEQELEQELELINKDLHPWPYIPWLFSPGKQMYT
jgi:hypothetical protein